MMYTVVLKRPDAVGVCFSHLDHDIDVIVVTVEAHIGAREAATSAQFEQAHHDGEALAKLCTMTEKDMPKPKHYRVLVVFEGVCEPKLSGWDLL